MSWYMVLLVSVKLRAYVLGYAFANSTILLKQVIWSSKPNGKATVLKTVGVTARGFESYSLRQI